MSDKEIIECAAFRTKNRLPALSYYYEGKGSLWRGSQNMTGLSSNRSRYDETMLLKIGQTNPNTDEVVIYDARSKINAMANKVKKGGYENTKKSYTNCSIQFCNIDNIHKVRQSYKKTMLICNNPGD